MANIFKIPWAVWREPGFIELEFPDTWDIGLCNMDGSGAYELSETEIKN